MPSQLPTPSDSMYSFDETGLNENLDAIDLSVNPAGLTLRSMASRFSLRPVSSKEYIESLGVGSWDGMQSRTLYKAMGWNCHEPFEFGLS